jgi:hypothetical protein
MYVYDVDSGLLAVKTLEPVGVCKLSFQVWIIVYISRFIHMYYVQCVREVPVPQGTLAPE